MANNKKAANTGDLIYEFENALADVAEHPSASKEVKKLVGKAYQKLSKIEKHIDAVIKKLSTY